MADTAGAGERMPSFRSSYGAPLPLAPEMTVP
jgi:hypothetical protein